MPSAEEFQTKLDALFSERTSAGAPAVTLVSGEFHRSVGGYPGPNHSMPNCCSVMRQNIGAGDQVLEEPPKGAGASLKIRYVLPRPGAGAAE